MASGELDHDDIPEQLMPLMLAFEEALAAGEAAPAIDASSLPFDLQPQLQQMQACLRLLDDARRAQSSFEMPGAADQGDQPEQIGRFELLRELGRGGFGVVFLARDPSIDRLIALKIPRPEVLVTTDLRQRFLQEAQAAGSLEHANLVSVYEVGEAGPICYIASAYCRGPSLAQWSKSSAGTIDIRLAAELVAQLADGVDHAHQRGVLHRDIKPSNILLDLPEHTIPSSSSAFAYTPRLTDFGLAKSAQSAEDLTCAGAVLGTPGYMAPEQAEGRSKDVGTSTDIYALGVVLYELLTGKLPYHGENDADTLRRISIGELVRPRRVRHEIPLDLEAVVLRCLERDPQRRYRSAGSLADDLGRFLAGEPTAARPLLPTERVWKWAKRRPAAAGVVLLTLALVFGLGFGGWWHSVQLSHALEVTRQREKEVRHFLYVTDIDRVKRALDSDNRRQARELLTRNIPKSDEPDLREFSWRHFWARIHEQLQTLEGHEGDVYFVSYSPDGASLATAGKDHTVRVWDVESGKSRLVLRGHNDEVNSVRFSGDGATLVSASDDGTIRLWDVRSGRQLNSTVANKVGVFQVTFALGGKVICSCGREPVIRLWDAVTLAPRGTLEGHTSDVECLAVGAGDKLLASGGSNGQIKLWDLELLTEYCTFQAGSKSISTLTFSKDGQRLINTGRESRESCEWSVPQKKQIRKISQHYDWVHGAALLDSERQLAVATKDGEIKLYDAKTAALLRSINGHENRVWCLAAAPDGNLLASASADGTVKIWSLQNRRSYVATTFPGTFYQARLAGDVIFLGGVHREIAAMNLLDHTERFNLKYDFELCGDFDGDGVQDGGYLQNGRWNLTLTRPDGRSELRTLRFGLPTDIPLVYDWNGDGRDDLGVFANGRWKFDLDGLGGDAEATVAFGNEQFSPEDRFARQVPLIGRWVPNSKSALGVAAFGDNTWHIQSQRKKKTRKIYHLTGGEFAVPIAGSFDNSGSDTIGLIENGQFWIDVAQSGGWAEYLCEPALGTPPRRMHDCNLSTQQHIIAVANPLTSLRQIEAAQDRCDAVHSRGEVLCLDVSSREPLMVTCHDDDVRIRLWNTTTGERVAVLRGHRTNVKQSLFSPDGAMLASIDDSGLVKIWDMASRAVRHEFRAHRQPVLRMAFSKNNQFLATSGDEGHVRVWRTSDFSEVLSVHQEIFHSVRAMCFSPDGSLLATGTSGRTVNLYRIPTGEHVARLTGHTDVLRCIAFSPDGRVLASAGQDESVRLWDIVTSQELCAFQSVGKVHQLIFSSDGEKLIALSATPKDSTIHIWSAPQAAASP